jgi:acetolactate synthase-1/2/3 large subunit
LHELPDQAGTLATFIKKAVRIDDPSRTFAIVNDAFRTAAGGRPGPVSVEMCWDTMARDAEIRATPAAAAPSEPAPDPAAVAAAARRIEQAQRPMIMCGAGAQHASSEVLALAELIGAPVTAFRSGRGVVPEDHALGVNPVAARELWDDVDLLIGIGSRLEMPYYRWGNPMRYEARPSSGPALIRIDVDPAEMERFIPDIAIVGDARVACRALVDALAPKRDGRYATRIAAAKALAARLVERIQPQTAYLRVIRDVLPRDGFLVPELSQVGFATYTGAFPVLAPRTYVTEGHQGTLGFGFPTALGVKVAHPDRSVVSITGDGGFMFAAQELGTAAQYRIGVVTLVFNNGAYANVLRDQETQFGGRIVGAKLVNPDFMKLAASFGVAGSRVSSPEALRPVLEDALGTDRPTLIEVALTEREASPWPLIHMHRKPSELEL